MRGAPSTPSACEDLRALEKSAAVYSRSTVVAVADEIQSTSVNASDVPLSDCDRAAGVIPLRRPLKTHCKRGHDLAEVGWVKNPVRTKTKLYFTRRCKACLREDVAKHSARMALHQGIYAEVLAVHKWYAQVYGSRRAPAQCVLNCVPELALKCQVAAINRRLQERGLLEFRKLAA